MKLGWSQIDIGSEANYENPADAKNANACPDPDAMITKGTVDYKDGAYTLTGSGEGFIHGWDQGNLVYFKTKIQGDFTFTAKVDRFEMTNGKPLNGAAEALLNVREDLNYRQPTQSVIAGAPPSKFIFMARYFWDGDPNNKWWHWPAWPTTWPNPRPLLSWTRSRDEAMRSPPTARPTARPGMSSSTTIPTSLTPTGTRSSSTRCPRRFTSGSCARRATIATTRP